MAINTTETHRRYYLFRHTGAGENIQWLDRNNDFVNVKEHTYYTVCKDTLKNVVTYYKRSSEDFIYVIGAVDVTVCGQVPLEIV